MKNVSIIKADPDKFGSIQEYLLHTYGEKKLKESKEFHSPTVLDVVGFTLDKQGFENVEGKNYELDEIEETMVGNVEDEEVE